MTIIEFPQIGSRERNEYVRFELRDGIPAGMSVPEYSFLELEYELACSVLERAQRDVYELTVLSPTDRMERRAERVIEHLKRYPGSARHRRYVVGFPKRGDVQTVHTCPEMAELTDTALADPRKQGVGVLIATVFPDGRVEYAERGEKGA